MIQKENTEAEMGSTSQKCHHRTWPWSWWAVGRALVLDYGSRTAASPLTWESPRIWNYTPAPLLGSKPLFAVFCWVWSFPLYMAKPNSSFESFTPSDLMVWSVIGLNMVSHTCGISMKSSVMTHENGCCRRVLELRNWILSENTYI